MENESPTPHSLPTQAAPASTNYMVVARRYRPKTFAQLVGQDHIAQALSTAIHSGRVGHAYLFTGARGVGKTSTARIFAKALNASADLPEEVVEDVSRAIDAGEDMDVIEIDGASNRGIEEIRQLRANVNVRPSRSTYKIYIIDEVHMLTNQAFNALLKTLEEPPGHVKFIFCTTDPDKIPITVLSRCQRFDFAPVKLEAIQKKLQEICETEGVVAAPEALALLARRAAGSMRDSQSLLEQVMSFADGEITVEQVHSLLGIADEGQIQAIAQALINCDALCALRLVDEAVQAGADAGQLAEQLLNYLRDLMAVGIGGGPELLKLANPAGHPNLVSMSESWGVQTILSAIQILDESLVRMRTSVSATTLIEVALVQICQLQSLASIPALLEAVLEGGQTTNRAAPAAVEKKNGDTKGLNSRRDVAEQFPSGQPLTTVPPASVPPERAAAASSAHLAKIAGLAKSNAAPGVVNSPSAADVSATVQPSAGAQALPGGSASAMEEWRRALGGIGDMLADFAGLAVSVVPQGSDHWNILFPPGAVKPREYCEQSERKTALQNALLKTLGRSIRLSFSVIAGEVVKPVVAPSASNTRVQKMRELSEHPYVKKVLEVFDGEIVRVDPAPALATQANHLTSKIPGVPH